MKYSVKFYLFVIIGIILFISCAEEGPAEDKAIETYLIPGDQLCEIAEKVLYKETPQEDMYLYILRPEGDQTEPLPAIVYFTGGGWVEGLPEYQIANAAWFRDQGIIGITADYRVKSRHGTTPVECVKDAKSAIRYVREQAVELKVDPDRIFAAGGSAGGHIATCAALTNGYEEEGENLTVSSKPNALVLHNPGLGGDGYGEWLFEDHPDLSPMNNIRPGLPPMIFSCGTEDESTPYPAAQKFETLSKEAGNICELITIEGAGHSCDWPVTNPNFLPTMRRMKEFLEENGLMP